MRRLLVLSTLLAVAWTSPARTQGGAQSRPAPSRPATSQSAPSPVKEQTVTPPEARYWMGATTTAGMFGMAGATQGPPSMGALLRGMTKASDVSHSVELRLGTSLAPKGEAEAFHTMPPGAQVNRPIALGPRTLAAPGAGLGYGAPKGKILFYWGCGDTVGPGQPVELTFDKVMRGETSEDLETLRAAVAARAVAKPSVRNSKTYGDWPHEDSKGRNKALIADFREGSTLAGRHTVEGTYTPPLDFTLDRTFMEPVRYQAAATAPSGTLPLQWRAVPRATGYSLGIIGGQSERGDATMVMWSSAERPATFILMEDLAPAEVARLIGLKAVLPPTTTSCAIPAPVLKAADQGMLMFTAFGDDATFLYPPRPEDQQTTWDQEWFARASFKSVRVDPITPRGLMALSQGDAANPGADPDGDAEPPSKASAAPGDALSDEDYCRKLDEEKRTPSAGDVLGAARGRLGRIGGRNREEPKDPRCAKR